MEEQTPQASNPQDFSSEFSQALVARRQQALDLIASQREHFDEIEISLETHLAQIEQGILAGLSDSSGKAPADLDQYVEVLRQQAAELDKQQAQLAAQRDALAARENDLKSIREVAQKQRQDLLADRQQESEEFDRRAADLRVAESKLKQAQRDFESAQEEHQSDIRQLATRKARLEEQQRRLEAEQHELETHNEETKTQRRRIAQQLKAEHSALVEERLNIRAEAERQRIAQQSDIERQQAKIEADREAMQQENLRLRQQVRREQQQLADETVALAEMRRQVEEATRRLAAMRSDASADQSQLVEELTQLRALLNQAKSDNAAAATLLRQLHDENGHLKLELSQKPAAQSAPGAAPIDWEVERAELEAQVADLTRRLEEVAQQPPPEASAQQSQEYDDLKRRFEMAVDDVRQLKRRNAELEEQRGAPQSGGGSAGASRAADGPMNWEMTKKRMLEELEADHDGQPAMSDDDRMTVEGAIRITDDMIAQRDQEIAELKLQLSEHAGPDTPADDSNPMTQPAVEMLDHDAVIQQERKRLLELQREWQDKLRQAEVDISVHRARIARERSEVDEKLRMLETEKAAMADQYGGGQQPASGKPKKGGGRWLARLGLKEGEKE